MISVKEEENDTYIERVEGDCRHSECCIRQQNIREGTSKARFSSNEKGVDPVERQVSTGTRNYALRVKLITPI